MEYDCGFTKDDRWFRYRAAGIIVEDGCVLFAGNDVDDYLYSVGGGVHVGETAEEAVVREVFEETGVRYAVDRLAFLHENFFEGSNAIGNLHCHELTFYFLMKPRGTRELQSHSTTSGGVPEHMHWISIEQLGSQKAYPSFLGEKLKHLQPGIEHIVTHEITVKPGVPADMESWMSLVRRVRGNFPGLETEDGLEDHRKTVLRFMEDQRALCVKLGETVVGVLLFSRKHNMICCLAVAPEYRRRGIGSALLKEALNRLDRNRDITVTTFRTGDEKAAAPRGLYSRFGFAEGKLGEEFGYPVQEMVLPGKAHQ